MVTRITVSELDAWQECRLKWYYQYRRRLRPATESPRSPALSGRAIHFGCEAGILNHTGLKGAVDAATTFLASFGEGSDRFMRGVETALGGVPEEIWEVSNPQAERPLEVEAGDVTFVGRPDLWFVNDDGLFVVDFKSTSSDEQDRLERYQTFNMQPRYYGAMLRRHLGTTLPIYFNHIILSTRGKHAYGPPWPLTRELEKMAWGRMEKVAEEMELMDDWTITGADYTPSILHANIGTHCVWCDFSTIDVALLTGGDSEDVIKTQYTVREGHS